MSLTLYLTIQQIVMGAIMVLGCHLIFVHVPDGLKGSRIHISGRIMGVASMIIPIASFIYYFSPMRYAGPQFATAINLTAYCLSSTIISLAYYVLLDRVEEQLYIKIHLGFGFVYPFPLWIIMFCGSELVIKHALIVAYTLFLVMAIVHVSSCIYFYRQRLAENSGDESQESKFIGRIIYASLAMIVVSLMAPSFFSYPMWLGVVFVVSFVGGAIYIYICYHKILVCNIHTLIIAEQVDDEDESEDVVEDATPLRDDVRSSIEMYIRTWIEYKEFLQSGITINDVAKATYTNRTYLSRYINTVYDCSFKVWITRLRIEEAKALMKKSPDLLISDVAEQTGFASIESFSHIFTRDEQMSPMRWRESNCDK